jgi:hypothetical protein
MKPLVTFLNAALHGIFRPKKKAEGGEAGGAGAEGGPGGGTKTSPEGDKKERDDNAADAPGEEGSSSDE